MKKDRPRSRLLALAAACSLGLAASGALISSAAAEEAAASPLAAEKAAKAPAPEMMPGKAGEKPEEKAEEKAAEKAAAPAPQKAAEKAQKPPKAQKAPKNKTASDYLSRPEVMAFLRELSKEKKIPLEWLKEEVAVARYSPLSEKYTTPKPKADKKTTPEKNFLLYRRNLVNSERIERGLDFIERNVATLERIERETGVSRWAVTAIIGVESIYGRNMGRFRVLDALMTLSFDYTRRAKYYRSELASFLDFCWRQQVAPVSVTGSFAGAVGLGQFMPASLSAYGRDGDGDGRIDIVKNEADGIASVANFLKVHGWARGERPLYPVEASAEIFRKTKSGGIKTHTTVGALLRAGVKPMGELPLKASEPAMLVDLPWIHSDDSRGTDYYIGTDSFAAILRYNRSYFYASAVTLLAYELESRWKAAEAKEASKSAEKLAEKAAKAPREKATAPTAQPQS